MRRTILNFTYSAVEYATKRLLCATLAVSLSACSSLFSSPPAPVPAVQAPVVAPVAKPAPRPPRVGLALGGGAARGFAHIGVLQVLEEQGIKPDIVVGTSAGSVVAALYAAGKSPVELGTMAMTLDESTMTGGGVTGRLVWMGEARARLVARFTNGKSIGPMPIPLGIVATDLGTGQPILFRRGDPGTAVRASSSVPAVFEPVRIGGREYVDGGLVSPIPVRYARQMGADLVIAVDISAIPEGQPTKGAVDILLQTFNIMGHSISQYELQDADVVMRPKLSGIGGGDFGNRRLSILAGREAALTVLAQLKEKIAAKTR